MNREIQKLIKKRNEKVGAFLASIDVIVPAFQNSVPTDTTNLCRNTKFHTLIRSEFFKYLKGISKSKKFKDVRVRHTLEEIAVPGFDIDELTDKGKLSVYSVLINRLAELDMFGDDTFKSSICSELVFNYVSKVVDRVPSTSWEVIVGTMIVDSMPEIDEKWLDMGGCIDDTVQRKYEDTSIIISKVDKVAALMELTDDYVDYVTMLLGINLFRFGRKLDDESMTQVFGNIGDLTDFREVASTVFLMELLSTENVDEWALRYLVQNIDILM